MVLLAQGEQIRELCAQLLICEDEAECLMLVSQLRFLLHEHIESLRGKLVLLSATLSEIEKAS